MNRATLLLALLLVGCTEQCSSVGGGAFGAARRAPAAAAACSTDVSAGALIDVNADTLALTLADSDPVASWADEGSMGGAYAILNSSFRPTFQNPCTGIGGAGPCLYFDGGDYLNWDGNPLLMDFYRGDFTFYFVGEPNSGIENDLDTIWANTRNVATQKGIAFYANDRTSDLVSDTINVKAGDSSWLDGYASDNSLLRNNGHVVAASYENGLAGDDLILYADRATAGSSDTVGSQTVNTTSLVPTIGDRETNNDAKFDGYMYRILIYGTPHDEATVYSNMDALDCALGETGWPK